MVKRRSTRRRSTRRIRGGAKCGYTCPGGRGYIGGTHGWTLVTFESLESQSHQSLESRMQGGPVLEVGELSVLEDLLPFIRRRLIQNIVVEMTPGWWPQIDATALLVEMEEFG